MYKNNSRLHNVITLDCSKGGCTENTFTIELNGHCLMSPDNRKSDRNSKTGTNTTGDFYSEKQA